MLAALLLSLALSHAVEGQPGTLLPGAVPVQAGAGAVAVGGGAYAVMFVGTGVFTSIEGSWAPSDRVQFAVDGLYAPNTGEGIRGGAVLGSARWVAVDHDAFRLAPFVALGGTDIDGLLAPGLALDTGFEAVRFDLSVPLVAAAVDPQGVFVPHPAISLMGIETGLSMLAGERDRIRLGATSALPNLSWKHTEERWFLEAMLGTALVWNAAHLAVGARF